MMKEVDHNDDEVVSLLEEDEKDNSRRNYSECVNRQFIAPKLFYFFFFSAQGSLMPYLALYYKQLHLSAAEAGLVSGAKMYVAFFIIPLWSMLVDKFKVGRLVFIMSSTALIATMLTISMAPGDICRIHSTVTTKRSYAVDGVSTFNQTMDSEYLSIQQNGGFKTRDSSDEAGFDTPSFTVTLKDSGATHSHFNLFLFLFLVTVCGTVFSCPCLSLADSATVELLAKNSDTHKYGKQRLWGSAGNGLAAFIVGASISRTNLCPGEEKQVNYYLCFYIYAVLLFLAIIAGSRLQFNTKLELSCKEESSRLLTSLRQVLVNSNYLIFLFTVFFDGVAMSFIKTFLFWYLKDLGGTQFLFSIISAVNCSVEVLMYFFSSIFIKRLGSIRVLCIGLLCYAIRFLYYAFVNKPWLVLIVEPLSGITTAALWSAIMSHVGLTTAKESAVTLQGESTIVRVAGQGVCCVLRGKLPWA